MDSTTAHAHLGALLRIYGFEAPVASAFAITTGLDELVDLRTRTRIRLLRADLLACGVVDPTRFPRFASGLAFRTASEALGWMYVIERNTMLHGIVRRQLERRLPELLHVAGSYLLGGECTVGVRLAELGAALDRCARDVRSASEIVDGANACFRHQRSWFARQIPTAWTRSTSSPPLAR